MPLLTLGKWRYTTGTQSNEDSQDIRRKTKGDMEMKAYRVTGVIATGIHKGMNFTSYYTASDEISLQSEKEPFWRSYGLRGITIEKVNKQELVDVINDLL